MEKKQKSSNKDTVCSNCGMAAADWPQGGYKLGSQSYCCQGCAEQTGCTCSEDSRATA